MAEFDISKCRTRITPEKINKHITITTKQQADFMIKVQTLFRT